MRERERGVLIGEASVTQQRICLQVASKEGVLGLVWLFILLVISLQIGSSDFSLLCRFGQSSFTMCYIEMQLLFDTNKLKSFKILAMFCKVLEDSAG